MAQSRPQRYCIGCVEPASERGQGHWPDEGALLGDNQRIPVIRFFLYCLATIADDLRNHWHVSLLPIEDNPLYESTTDPADPSGRRGPWMVSAFHGYNVALR